ncbi:serine/threonine-protein phosphatase [bacterium]|nr:serine/threonine-protein phosphatase [bacterium]
MKDEKLKLNVLREKYNKLKLRYLVDEAKYKRDDKLLRALYKELRDSYASLQEELDRGKQELKVASGVQKRFLPRKTPKLHGIEIAGKMISGKAVGGDFYFYRSYRKSENKFAVCIGDVAGSGVPAALLMTLCVGVLKEITAANTLSPKETLQKINQEITPFIGRHSTRFVSMIYGILDLSSGNFCFARAGHSYPLVYSNGSGGCRSIETDGTVLGKLKNIHLREKQVSLKAGDEILFFTDGITETTNSRKEFFGNERLSKLLVKHHHLTAKKQIRKIFEAVHDFAAPHSRFDDMTLVLLKRHKEDIA